MRFTKEEEALLNRRMPGRICTIDEDGRPHCVAIDYLYEKGRIYMGTGPRTKKVRNLEGNPEVAFEVDVDDYVGSAKERFLDWRGLMMQGRAFVVREEARARRVIAGLLQKYPGNSYEADTAVIEVRPDRKFTWGPWDRVKAREKGA